MLLGYLQRVLDVSFLYQIEGQMSFLRARHLISLGKSVNCVLRNLTEMRNVPKVTIVVHAVANCELFIDQEACVVSKVAPCYVFRRLLVECNRCAQRLYLKSRLYRCQHGSNCRACVDHILYQKHILAVKPYLHKPLHSLYLSCRLRILIAAQPHEVRANLNN